MNKQASSPQDKIGNDNGFQATVQASRGVVHSLRAKEDEKRTTAEKIADWMTEKFGSFTFFIINAVWFIVWLVINTGMIPGVEPFDPFPFGMLTMIVSLEAIFLAIFVLISQNRASKVAELREEVDLQVDIITEEELTKLLTMMKLLLEKNGIDISNDDALQSMLKPTDVETLENVLEQEVVAKAKEQHKPTNQG
jgi:uncharacterized membrane protein